MEAPWKRAKKGGGEQWKASSSSSSSSTITDLPNHIFMEIMLRLPIKTIVATKCVCKSWLHLINDPHFAKLHHSRAKVEVCFQRFFNKAADTKLYMANFCFPNGSQSLGMNLNTLLQLPEFGHDLNDLYNDKADWVTLDFVNSCNGLLCYFSYSVGRALIWNPTTSEFITIPAPKTTKVLATWRGFGLGFSQKANRFKLLCIMGGKKKVSSEVVVVAKICTIEKGCSWKTVARCPYTSWEAFGRYAYGAFLRGSLHWIGSHNSHPIIVSFDFEDEKFAIVPLPPYDKARNINYQSSRFGVLADCLFVTETTFTSFNIWFMKEYGVQDSWTKVISLNFSPAESRKYRCCRPVNYLDNGEILLMNTFICLFLYNPVLKSVRDIGSSHCSIRAITYRPSLVLLKDSIAASDLPVKSRCAGLEHRVMDTTPSWWESVEDERKRRMR